MVRLAEGGLVEVGAHTVTHSVLSTQSREEQHREITASKRTLETLLGRPVPTFSYPFGGRTDYTPETVALLQEAGFSCACSNFPAWVQPRTPVYELPRYLARGWDGETFAARVDAWFRGESGWE